MILNEKGKMCTQILEGKYGGGVVGCIGPINLVPCGG